MWQALHWPMGLINPSSNHLSEYISNLHEPAPHNIIGSFELYMSLQVYISHTKCKWAYSTVCIMTFECHSVYHDQNWSKYSYAFRARNIQTIQHLASIYHTDHSTSFRTNKLHSKHKKYIRRHLVKEYTPSTEQNWAKWKELLTILLISTHKYQVQLKIWQQFHNDAEWILCPFTHPFAVSLMWH